MDFILISLTSHFLNVIEDLEWDRTQPVLGLPQYLGEGWTINRATIISGQTLLFQYLPHVAFIEFSEKTKRFGLP